VPPLLGHSDYFDTDSSRTLSAPGCPVVARGHTVAFVTRLTDFIRSQASDLGRVGRNVHSTYERRGQRIKQRLAAVLTFSYGLHSIHRPSDPPLRVVWWFSEPRNAALSK